MGIDFIELPAAEGIGGQAFRRALDDMDAAQRVWAVLGMFFGVAMGYTTPLAEVAEDFRPQVMLGESTSWAALFAAELVNVPVATFDYNPAGCEFWASCSAIGSRSSAQSSDSRAIPSSQRSTGGSRSWAVLQSGSPRAHCRPPRIWSTPRPGPPRRRVGGRSPEDAGRPAAGVLPHCSAMLARDGYGSLMGALRHGVPVVSVPLAAADNARNAVKHEKLGAGIAIHEEARSPRAIGDAISAVLSMPGYRDAAQRLATSIASLAPTGHAATLLERLAAERRPIES